MTFNRPTADTVSGEILLRSLEPSDVVAVTRLHAAAFPSFFLTTLGSRFLQTYYERFANEPGAVALVAADVASQELLGFVVGSIDPRGFYRRLLARHWVSFVLAAIPALVRRPQIAPRLARAFTHPGSNPPGSGVAGLFSIAVAPSAQGRSIGGRLLRGFIEVAATRGCREVFLTTDADSNHATNEFYRGHGFERRRQYATPEGRRMNEYWHEVPDDRR